MTEQEIRDLLTCALVSVVTVAVILGVKSPTVRRMICGGRLDAVNVGMGSIRPRYLVKSESVLRLLDMELVTA